MRDRLPVVLENWMGVMLTFGQVLLIVFVAWLLKRAVQRLIRRVNESYNLPPQSLPGARRVAGFLINTAALLLILQRLGVSGTVLWTAFSGFAAVGAVAFFAAWSVLSNIFCTMLIFTTNQFRINDHIEVLENGEKPGFKGRVIDINLIYTTLEEANTDPTATRSVLQVPNNMFFQRAVRRWRSTESTPMWRMVTPK
ncbi:MAG: mechanosensitive ion channel family protein [Gemmatimonadaceae bacterium]|nr:mechanosensitive ion channel family protein [Gemmatimonadaceae bacterium]